MALFMRQPIVQSETPLYTLSTSNTVLIIGLGNPEAQYDGTRHNVGFAALDAFAQAHDFDPWVNKKDLHAIISQKALGNTRVLLAKPTTYMNNSGEAIQSIAHFYKLSPDDIIIVHDELDIDFGTIRTRTGGSAAGNNGIKSIIQHGYEPTGRVRIGIGPKIHPSQDSADFVLGKFSASEQSQLPKIYNEITSILTDRIFSGALFAETRNI